LPLACTFAPASAADRYLVNLTRKDRNLYKIDGERLWVQTRYCYAYAYSEQVALTAHEAVFLDSDNKCDVKNIFSEANVSPGTYQVKLTREDDDLYSTLDGMLVKTSMCYHYGYSDDAILRLNGYGGNVVFVNAEKRCQVDVILSKVRL
jgi:hypothetical protein